LLFALLLLHLTGLLELASLLAALLVKLAQLLVLPVTLRLLLLDFANLLVLAALPLGPLLRLPRRLFGLTLDALGHLALLTLPSATLLSARFAAFNPLLGARLTRFGTLSANLRLGVGADVGLQFGQAVVAALLGCRRHGAQRQSDGKRAKRAGTGKLRNPHGVISSSCRQVAAARQ
jgi:hypothetical protein